ncbi:MAG: hypothetical protein ACI8P0_001397 [Planctomycetaceae bacterium]|jgi:uncharacterized protein (TIGR02646 family)
MDRPEVQLPTLSKINHWKDGRNAKGEWSSVWNNADVRGALFAMHGSVCSYCLCKFDRDRGDVEHFRPKKIYPWLAYSFSNYLLSCLTCNRVFKREKFPVEPESERIANEGDDTECEPRRLLDPVFDTSIENWLHVDITDEDVPLQCCLPTSQSIERDRVLETVEFFELNLDRTLIGKRREAVQEAHDVFKLAKNGTLGDDKRNAFRRSASRRKAHGMTRRLVIQQLDVSDTFATSLLPTAHEEMEWWLNTLVEMLATEMRLLGKANKDQSRRRLKAKCKELRWALATIWKCPAPITANDVERVLVSNGIVKQIRPLKILM